MKAATSDDWEAVIGYLPKYNQKITKQPKGSDRRARPSPRQARLLNSSKSFASTQSALLSPSSTSYSARTPTAPRDLPRHHRTPSKSDRPVTARPRLPALAGHKSVVHLPDKIPGDDSSVPGDVVLPSMAVKSPAQTPRDQCSSDDPDYNEKDLAKDGIDTGSIVSDDGADGHQLDVCHEWLSEIESTARKMQPKGPVNCTSWVIDVKQNELKQESEQMLTQMQSNTKRRSRVLALGRKLRTTTASKDSHWMHYLRSLPLLAGMHQKQLDEVYARLATEEFARGDYILRQNESFGDAVFVIFRGVASAFYTDSERRFKKMATLRQQSSVGAAELMCCPSAVLGYNADIIAESDLACLRIPRQLIGDSHPEIPGRGRPISPTKAAEFIRRTSQLSVDLDGVEVGESEALSRKNSTDFILQLRTMSGSRTKPMDWSRGTQSVGWTLRRNMLQERVVVSEAKSGLVSFVKRHIGWFKSFADGDVPQILSKLHLLYFLEGDKLLQQGERGGAVMYVLYEGLAEAMQYCARTGEMKSVGHYSKGDEFGTGAVLKSEAYEASVFARSDCKLIGIPRSLLVELGIFEGAKHLFEESHGEMEIAALRQHFDAFDTDSDGSLDRDELYQLLRRLGFKYLPHEFEVGFTMMETRLGRTVDFDAFKEFWQRCNFLDPLNVKQLGEKMREARAASVSPTPWGDADDSGDAGVITKTEEEEEMDGLMAQAAEEARSVWNRYDVDRSNSLDKYEVRMLLIDLGFEDCSAARIEREMSAMDRDDNGQVDFEEFIYWWMSAKVQSHFDPSVSRKAATAAVAWIQGHHPTLELPEASVRAFFDLLHKNEDDEVSVIEMIQGVKAHIAEAVEFGFTTAHHEADKEKIVVAFDVMRQPGTHRITIENFLNYFGPKGRVRGGASTASDGFASGPPRSANTLWAAVRGVL